MLMVVYDVTSSQSFEAVTDWHKMALSAEWDSVAKCPIASVLFANKKDCTMRRVVIEKAGMELAEKLDMQYFEGSAVCMRLNKIVVCLHKVTRRIIVVIKYYNNASC